ncbi:hypothetical protein B0H11DRAFT_2037255 [Mycena galericulata]|nr:hypothetical protein B0H11DRAFT_2037255 [Mycena galericulata]
MIACKILSTTQHIVVVTQEILVECSLALRVCAMYGFNRRVFVSLGIAAATTLALGIWSMIGPEVVVLKTALPGCHVTTPRPELRGLNSVHTGAAVAWEALLICDILILCLTLRRAVTYHRSVGLSSGSLLPIMLTAYRVICAMNLANIIMYYIITAGSLAWFATAISVTMISRLMLNLHDAANGDFPLTFTAQYDHPEHELDPIQFRMPGMSLVGRILYETDVSSVN